MTEALEDAGFDPDHTPVDQMPEAGQWALAYYFESLEEDA